MLYFEIQYISGASFQSQIMKLSAFNQSLISSFSKSNPDTFMFGTVHKGRPKLKGGEGALFV